MAYQNVEKILMVKYYFSWNSP